MQPNNKNSGLWVTFVFILVVICSDIMIFVTPDRDFSDTENLDTENQHQASEHLEKPHDYIITKEEISKKKYQVIKYQSINPVPHMKAVLKNVLMMDRWTDICRKKKYIPKW